MALAGCIFRIKIILHVCRAMEESVECGEIYLFCTIRPSIQNLTYFILFSLLLPVFCSSRTRKQNIDTTQIEIISFREEKSRYFICFACCVCLVFISFVFALFFAFCFCRITVYYCIHAASVICVHRAGEYSHTNVLLCVTQNLVAHVRRTIQFNCIIHFWNTYTYLCLFRVE